MRRVWILLATIAWLVPLLPAAVPRWGPPAWGQTPGAPSLEGLYVIPKEKGYFIKEGRNWEEATLQDDHPRRLWLTNNEYIWERARAPSNYRTAQRIDSETRRPVQTIQLCRHLSGDVIASDPRKLHLEVQVNTLTQRTVLVWDSPLGRSPVPAELLSKPKRICKESDWLETRAAPSRLVVAGPQVGLLPPILQVQTGPVRVVDGELLLTVKSSGERSKDDLPTWACLARRGYPKVELVEQPNGPAQTVFVWPDASFQADLRGGVPHKWSLLDSECGVVKQPGGDLRPGPANPVATDEKIVLGCVISEKRFAECRGWWLVRP